MNIPLLTHDQARAKFESGTQILFRLKGDDIWTRILTTPDWNDQESEYIELSEALRLKLNIEGDPIEGLLAQNHLPFMGRR